MKPILLNPAFAAPAAGLSATDAPAFGGPIDTFVMMASDELKPTRPMRIKKRAEIVPASHSPDPKPRGVWEKVKEKLSPGEIKWRRLARGHERPRKIYRSSEEAEGRVAEAEFKLLSNYVSLLAMADLDDRNAEHREEVKETAHYATAASLNETFKARVLAWMDADYAGDTVRQRLDRYEPVLVTFVASPHDGPYISGAYHIGTNCIHTDYRRLMETTDAGMKIVHVAHELHHYASWLGGGMKIRWRDREGRPCFKKRRRLAWLTRDFRNERLSDILTTALSHQLVQDLGVEIAFPDSPEEVIMGLMLQEIAGRDEVRRAYFSGDYTKVARGLDDRLGEGTFVEMLRDLDSGPYGIWGALALLFGRINERRLEAKGYWSEGMGRKIIEERDYYARFIPYEYREK